MVFRNHAHDFRWLFFLVSVITFVVDQLSFECIYRSCFDRIFNHPLIYTKHSLSCVIIRHRHEFVVVIVINVPFCFISITRRSFASFYKFPFLLQPVNHFHESRDITNMYRLSHSYYNSSITSMNLVA